MEKTFRYFFEHTVFQKRDGVIQDHFKNHYEIIAPDASTAHTQVPYNSILQAIKSMDNQILHDFRVCDRIGYRQLREKIKTSGRGSLCPMEYEDAIRFGLIK